MLTRARFTAVSANLLALLAAISIFLAVAQSSVYHPGRDPRIPRTPAEFATCSPLLWLIDNLLVLDLPTSGGWKANGEPVDSAKLAAEFLSIYRAQPAAHRLLVVQEPGSRKNEDLTWLLAPLDSLGVIVVARPPWPLAEDHSPRVVRALDNWKAGSISAESAASTIADELMATCALIAEDTVQAMHPYLQAELARRAGWN